MKVPVGREGNMKYWVHCGLMFNYTWLISQCLGFGVRGKRGRGGGGGRGYDRKEKIG